MASVERVVQISVAFEVYDAVELFQGPGHDVPEFLLTGVFGQAVSEHVGAACCAEVLGDAGGEIVAGEFGEEGWGGFVAGGEVCWGQEVRAGHVAAGVAGAEVGLEGEGVRWEG